MVKSARLIAISGRKQNDFCFEGFYQSKKRSFAFTIHMLQIHAYAMHMHSCQQAMQGNLILIVLWHSRLQIGIELRIVQSHVDVVLVLSSERHAELCCCALHIGNGLHGICIKIKKEQSQQYHSNTSSHLFRYIEYFSSTIFECYRFHRLSCCGKLSIGRLSALRDLICFLKEKIFSF